MTKMCSLFSLVRVLYYFQEESKQYILSIWNAISFYVKRISINKAFKQQLSVV